MKKWNFVNFGKNRIFCIFFNFFQKFTKTFSSLKIDPGVVYTFRDRFWKAQGVNFSFLNFLTKFGYFCNLNGKKTSQLPKRNIETVIPFWLQKGIKICKFVDAIFFFEKYGPSAFQNRSRNLYTTSGCDFMMIWSLVKKA